MDLTKIEDFGQSWWPVVISFVISLIAMIRMYAAGPNCPTDERIDNKVVVITGASSGIGLVTATELAKRGGKIILTCRDKNKGQQAIELIKLTVPRAQIDLRLLNVANMTEIRTFSAQLIKDYEKIDVLINNAAIIHHPYERTSENFELTFATNYLGPFLLTNLLLPCLKKSENGRIINIGSPAHYAAAFDLENLNYSQSYSIGKAHGETKLALIMFTKHLAKQLRETNITVNAVNPGLVRGTNHLQKTMVQNNNPMMKISLFPWTWLFLKSPKQGAQSIVYACTDSTLRKMTGKYISDCDIKVPAESTNDEGLVEKLYLKTCEMLGISSP